LEKVLSAYPPETASRITGVPAVDIIKAAREYAKADTAALLYSMGITQHISGTDNVIACADLALICGQVGKKGAGIFPLRGQNNVQGACDMGGLDEYFPGYKKVGNREAAAELERIWEAERLSEKPGLTAAKMSEAV